MSVAAPPDIKRLRFRCRRGMWEIDFLLQKFTDSAQFDQLQPAQAQQLEQLLDLTDPELLEILVYQFQAPEHLEGVIKLIRSFNTSSNTASGAG